MNKRKDEYAQRLYGLYQQGLSLAQIAEKEGKTRQSIFGLFSNRKLPLRSKKYLEYQTFDGLKFSLRNNGYLARTDGDRELMHRYVWRFYNGEIPSNHDIHHRNENKLDNRLENLELISKAEHTSKYSPNCNQFVHRCGK